MFATLSRNMNLYLWLTVLLSDMQSESRRASSRPDAIHGQLDEGP